MGSYSAEMKKGDYPDIIALQNTDAQIGMKVQEYKQAIKDYLNLVKKDDVADDSKCPFDAPFPFDEVSSTGSVNQNALCCPSGKIKRSGRFPRRHSKKDGNYGWGPSRKPERLPDLEVGGQSEGSLIDHHAVDEESCINMCSRMPGCRAAVITNDPNEPCLLKSDDSVSVPKLGTVSYRMKTPRQCGGNGGGEIPSEVISSPNNKIADSANIGVPMKMTQGECNLACTNSPDCVAFSYKIDPSGNTCQLKNAAGPLEAVDGGDHLIDDGTNPDTWGNTCQGLTNRFGVHGNYSWGCAPQAAQNWYIKNSCGYDENNQLLKPEIGTTPVACGKPRDTADNIDNNWYKGYTPIQKCDALSRDFGIGWSGKTGYGSGVVPGTEMYWGGATEDIKGLWNKYGCGDKGVGLLGGAKAISDFRILDENSQSLRTTFAGYNPTYHVDPVNTFLLNSPKPCLDPDTHEGLGYLDWCTSNKSSSCNNPPCKPSGGICPTSHPYPHTRDGIEDGGCCDTPPPAPLERVKKDHRTPVEKAAAGLLQITEIGKQAMGMSDPIDLEEDAGYAKNPVAALEEEELDSTPVQSGAKPAPAPSPSFGSGAANPPQSTPLFEGFTGVSDDPQERLRNHLAKNGNGQCSGKSVPCPGGGAPCRSGLSELERQNAWKKVNKLNDELRDLTGKATKQNQIAYTAGVANQEKTTGNNKKLKKLTDELNAEHKLLEKAQRQLDHVNTESGEGNMLAKSSLIHQGIFIVILVIALAVSAKVVIRGTVGIADMLACIAGACLLGYYMWAWLREKRSVFVGYTRNAVDAASSAGFSFL